MHALIEYDRVAAPRERHDSLLDRVTGLPRWELLIDRIEVALGNAWRTGSEVTLFLVYAEGVDIPDIVTFADHLRLWLQDGDTVARIGLSDFGILCNEARTKKRGGTTHRARRRHRVPARVRTGAARANRR